MVSPNIQNISNGHYGTNDFGTMDAGFLLLADKFPSHPSHSAAKNQRSAPKAKRKQ